MNKIQQAQLTKDIIVAERNRCASIARQIYDRASRDGMLAAMHTAQQVEHLIREQPL